MLLQRFAVGLLTIFAGLSLVTAPTVKAVAEDKPEVEAASTTAEALRLKELLGAKNKVVMVQALRDLGKVKGPTAREILVKFIKKSKNAEHASYATESLGWAGNAKAVDFLCGKHGVKSKKLLVSIAACGSLGDIGDKRAVPTLLEAIKQKKVEITKAGIRAVVRIDPAAPGIAKLMVKLAGHKSDPVREEVALAMGVLTDPMVVKPLIKMATRDGQSIVRLNACRSLGRLGVAEAREPLAKVAEKDKSADVRRAASEALGSLSRAGSGQ